MVRDIQILTYCDPCHRDGQITNGVERTGQLEGMRKAKKLAFCEVHMKEFFAPLLELFEELGQEPEDMPVLPGSAPREPAVVCKICGGSFASAGSFGGHVRKMHGLGVPEYREKYADAPTPAAVTLPKKPPSIVPVDDLSITCPIEGCETVYATPVNARPRQAIAIHLSKKHKIPAGEQAGLWE